MMPWCLAQDGGLTVDQVTSLAYNMRACNAQVVLLQQLNLFSKEYEVTHV